MKTIFTIILLLPFLAFSQYNPKSPFEDAICLDKKNIIKNLLANDTLLIVNSRFGCFQSGSDTLKVFLDAGKYCAETIEFAFDLDNFKIFRIRQQKLLSNEQIQKLTVIEAMLSETTKQIIQMQDTSLTQIEFFLHRKSVIYFIGESYDSDISFESF